MYVDAVVIGAVITGAAMLGAAVVTGTAAIAAAVISRRGRGGSADARSGGWELRPVVGCGRTGAIGEGKAPGTRP